MTVQVSEEEISFLTKGEDPYDDAVVRKLFHENLKLLLVTEGAEGCRYYTKVSLPNMLFWKFISTLAYLFCGHHICLTSYLLLEIDCKRLLKRSSGKVISYKF